MIRMKADRVVDHQPLLLERSGRLTDDMDNLDLLCQTASDAVHGAQLAYTFISPGSHAIQVRLYQRHVS